MNIDEKGFFREATLRICGSLEIDQALHRCLLYLRNFIPTDHMTLNFLDFDSSYIHIYAMADQYGGKRSDIKFAVPHHWLPGLANPEIFPDLLIVNRPQQARLARLYLETLGKPRSSLLTMRLRLEGELLGNLTLQAEGLDRYHQGHQELLAQLNDPWAIALTNSRRFSQLLELKESLADDNRYLQEEMRRLAGKDIIGAEGGLKQVLGLVRRVAPLESPVLLLGETGVGKEVFASRLHDLSPRREGPFIKVNCGAIPGTLLDSELFGHERGAFTGAVARKRGCFERAHGGTIFLDEVAELSLEAQVRLLRVLQEKEIERVGGSQTTKVDIRVIAATHRDLEEMVGAGSFRQDLYYRLKVFPIWIPPLRERKGDIPALVDYFVQRKSVEMGLFRVPPLAPGALPRLLEYHWPGNVRELENAVERALIVNQGGPLDFRDILRPLSPPAPAWPGRSRAAAAPVAKLDEVVARHIRSVLELAAGKVEGPGGAAELLGVNPGTLRHRMRKLGIAFGRRARSRAGAGQGPGR